MRFYLVGTPNNSKDRLLKELASGELGYVDGISVSDDIALGHQADYRVELKLACDRCFSIMTHGESDDTIFSHSLIDSFAYATARAFRMADHKGVADTTIEKAALVSALIGSMLKDSFKYDHVFMLRKEEEDDEELEAILLAILDAFSIPYSLLESSFEDNLKAAKEVIASYGGEHRNDLVIDGEPFKGEPLFKDG